MIGVVALIDLDENCGVLVDKDRNQHPFSLDECIGFDSPLEVGEKVEFDLSAGEIFFVQSLREDKPRDAIQDVIHIDKAAPAKKKTNKDLHVDIPLDLDILSCLEIYFEEVVFVAYEYEAKFEDGEFLDFLLMKRFLNTAYNNLRDMDSTFMDEHLVRLRDDLKVLESVYRKFYKKMTTPEVVYETAFLEKQAIYQNHKKRIDTNISELYTLKSTIESLEIQIKDMQKKIDYCNNAEEIESKKIDLKRLNSYFVDSIHRSGILKDENTQLKTLLDKFEKRYRDEFIFIYTDEAKKYDEFLKEQLNGYAYEFDKKMWKSAEKSSVIHSFFKRAKIEDDFSSKTFLKYFIRGLDETKYSKEHKRLHSLLDYLQSRAKVRILIVSENRDKLDCIKRLIRNLDKEYSVEVSDMPRSSYYRKDFVKLDVIFADFSMRNPIIYEYIDMVKKRVVQAGGHAALCVTSDSFNKNDLIKIKEKKINHVLATNLEKSKIEIQIKKIIDLL